MNLRCILVDNSPITFSSWEQLFEYRVSIKKLDCSNNQLTELPNWLGDLTNLEILDCSNNLLTVTPPQLNQLIGNKLISFKYKGNQFQITSVAQMRRLKARELHMLPTNNQS